LRAAAPQAAKQSPENSLITVNRGLLRANALAMTTFAGILNVKKSKCVCPKACRKLTKVTPFAPKDFDVQNPLAKEILMTGIRLV
jgi:hypothetical protein